MAECRSVYQKMKFTRVKLSGGECKNPLALNKALMAAEILVRDRVWRVGE